MLKEGDAYGKSDNLGNVPADISVLSEKEALIFVLIRERDISIFAELSGLTGQSEKTVRMAVSNFKEKGYVRKIGGKRFGKWTSVSKSD